LPPRVEAVIAERVGRLPRDWRHVLDAAAVVGSDSRVVSASPEILESVQVPF